VITKAGSITNYNVLALTASNGNIPFGAVGIPISSHGIALFASVLMHSDKRRNVAVELPRHRSPRRLPGGSMDRAAVSITD
jgi:hypothetical protein